MEHQPPADWREPRHVEVTIDISPEQAEALLGLLQDDDEFRSRLEQSPREVLGEYGIDVKAGLPETVVLPPRHELAALVNQARERNLLEVGPDMPHVFALLWWVVGAMPLVPRDR